MKLSAKSTIIFGLGGFLILAMTSFFVYRTTTSALRDNIEEKQLVIGKQAMDQVDRLLYGYYLGIQSIAEEEHIERTLSGALTDRRVIQRRIKELPFLTGPWDVISVVDLKGSVVVSNKEESQEKDPDELLAIEEAIKGNAYYSDFIISKETGKPTMIFAAPIRDQETTGDPIVGVALGQIAWPAVGQVIKGFDPVNEFGLYNNKGLLIATNQETSEDLLIINDEVVDYIKNGDNMSRESENEFLLIHVNSVGFLTYKGNGWALFIKTPRAIALAPAVRTAQNIVLIILPIIICVVGLIFWVFRHLMISPIIDLTNVANVIAQGDLNRRMAVKSKDEIGELGLAFNSMTDKLQNFYTDLEGKVKERTKQLNDKILEIENMNRFMINREVKMAELKKELEELRSRSP